MKNLTNGVIIHNKCGEIQYLQFKRLLEFTNIRHAYAIKPQNYRVKISDDNYEQGISNYEKLCKICGIDNYIKPEQFHTNTVNIVEVAETDIREKFKKTDGLITNKPNVLLSTVNADCIIVLFYDPVKNVIANSHSGWRGTVEKISEVTVNKMIKEYNCNPKDIICCICPSIRKCHFEVEKPVKDIFEESFKYTGKINEFIEYKGKEKSVSGEEVDKWLIDTVLINKIMLMNCGIVEENIIDSGICSVCNSDAIHSCRVEGKDNYENNTAVIGIV